MPNEKNSHSVTDGFHLVVDALKLNGIDTIFGVAGIPITDLARLAQAEGMRYIGFRHEAVRRKCGCDRRLSDEEAGDLSHGVSPRLSERHGGTGECDHQRLPDDPDQRIERQGDRRSPAGRLRRTRSDERGEAVRKSGFPRQQTRRYRHRSCARYPCGSVRAAGWRLPGSDRRRPWRDPRHRCGHPIAGTRSRSSAPAASPTPSRSNAPSTCWRAPSVRSSFSAKAPHTHRLTTTFGHSSR